MCAGRSNQNFNWPCYNIPHRCVLVYYISNHHHRASRARCSHGARVYILWYLIRFALCNPSPPLADSTSIMSSLLTHTGSQLSLRLIHMFVWVENWDDRYVRVCVCWVENSGAHSFWENPSTDYHIISIDSEYVFTECITTNLRAHHLHQRHCLVRPIINLIYKRVCVCFCGGVPVHWTTRSPIRRIGNNPSATGRFVERSKSDLFSLFFFVRLNQAPSKSAPNTFIYANHIWIVFRMHFMQVCWQHKDHLITRVLEWVRECVCVCVFFFSPMNDLVCSRSVVLSVSCSWLTDKGPPPEIEHTRSHRKKITHTHARTSPQIS